MHVQYENEENALKALSLDGMVLDGRELNIDLAAPPRLWEEQRQREEMEELRNSENK